MSWIKNFALGTFSILISYCLLVLGDWYIQTNIDQQLDQNLDYSEAQNIEKLRRKNEDFPLKDRQPRQKVMKKKMSLSQKKGHKKKQTDNRNKEDIHKKSGAKSKKTTKRDVKRNFRK